MLVVAVNRFFILRACLQSLSLWYFSLHPLEITCQSNWEFAPPFYCLCFLLFWQRSSALLPACDSWVALVCRAGGRSWLVDHASVSSGQSSGVKWEMCKLCLECFGHLDIINKVIWIAMYLNNRNSHNNYSE